MGNGLRGSTVSGESSRCNNRTNTAGSSKFSRLSSASCCSQDLVICHFKATPLSTVMYYIDTLIEHMNAHIGGMTCCTWHASVRTIAGAVEILGEQACKMQTWVPSSGWQCHECLALNDVDDDDCIVCYG